MSTSRSSSWSRIQSRYQRIFSLPGTRQTYSIAPPSSACFSNSVTWWPRSVVIRAASMPAGPPPTTATRTGLVVRTISAYAGLPQAALMEQAISFFAISDSCQQPPRQEMHFRIDLTFPYCALTGQ